METTEIIIKRKRTDRFFGVASAAKRLGVTTCHLTRCLHGERELARDKMPLIKIVDIDTPEVAHA